MQQPPKARNFHLWARYLCLCASFVLLLGGICAFKLGDMPRYTAGSVISRTELEKFGYIPVAPYAIVLGALLWIVEYPLPFPAAAEKFFKGPTFTTNNAYLGKGIAYIVLACGCFYPISLPLLGGLNLIFAGIVYILRGRVQVDKK